MATSTSSLSGRASIEREVSDDEVVEHVLRVYIERTTWDERHPYGDTTAVEHLSEDEVTSYELDGQDITHAALIEKFGQADADEAIERAISNAE